MVIKVVYTEKELLSMRSSRCTNILKHSCLDFMSNY